MLLLGGVELALVSIGLDVRFPHIFKSVLQHQASHRRQPSLPIIEKMPGRGKHGGAVISTLGAEFKAPAESDRSSSVPDTTGSKDLRRRRGDTETQVLGKVDDGLRELAVVRLELLPEQANGLFNRYLKDVADDPGVNTEHRVDLDGCLSSKLDQRLPIDPCLQHPSEVRT